MSKQKYTVLYQKPWEETKKRTRFSSLKVAKERKETMEDHGWRCSIIAKNDYVSDEKPKQSKVIGRFNNIVNHWQFIPQKDGDTLCIKNGQYVPIQKCLY